MPKWSVAVWVFSTKNQQKILEGVGKENKLFQVQYVLGDQKIHRKVNDPAGKLLSTWRLLRDHHPDSSWMNEFVVFGQPAAWCDSVISQWISEYIREQAPDTPQMIVTDCLGSSWSPESVQQYWINNQAAFPLAPNTTSYLQPSDTHIHAPLKAYLRQAKNDLQEEADREMIISDSRGPHQWGPWHTSTVVSRALRKLQKLQNDKDVVLTSVLQTQLLVFRPNQKGQLIPVDMLDDEPWLLKHPRLPVLRGISQKEADARIHKHSEWENGEPPEPDWSVLDKLGSYLSQSHHPAEDPEDPESQAVVLDGRFADLALTPAQVEMLKPVEERIKMLPRGASVLVKRAENLRKIREKKQRTAGDASSAASTRMPTSSSFV